MRDFLLYATILIVSLVASSFAPSGSASDITPEATYQPPKTKRVPNLDIDSLRRDLDVVESRCAQLEQFLERTPIKARPSK